ncbi:MAG: hypothetical protein IJ587_12795 [Synergistaceae bacterium]|nr:hypothetical protein [Synergistaceae bacterium]
MSESNTVIPLSAFNEGRAAEIFGEVRRSGTRLVVNDDDSAACIPMSPEEYSDKFNEAVLIGIARERMKHFDRSRLVSQEEFDKRFGITEKDLEGWEEIELE